jgi:hypothetical protein
VPPADPQDRLRAEIGGHHQVAGNIARALGRVHQRPAGKTGEIGARVGEAELAVIVTDAGLRHLVGGRIGDHRRARLQPGQFDHHIRSGQDQMLVPAAKTLFDIGLNAGPGHHHLAGGIKDGDELAIGEFGRAVGRLLDDNGIKLVGAAEGGHAAKACAARDPRSKGGAGRQAPAGPPRRSTPGWTCWRPSSSRCTARATVSSRSSPPSRWSSSSSPSRSAGSVSG